MAVGAGFFATFDAGHTATERIEGHVEIARQLTY
jgi:hypothetical protein